jgi:hypothetical protein
LATRGETDLSLKSEGHLATGARGITGRCGLQELWQEFFVKIYFAGSIRGGREDAGIYSNIISILKEYGIVLTEHIGAVEVENEKAMSDEEIYLQDINWLCDSDIFIAEVTNPSLGVGYEIGFAEANNKEIICLFRTGKHHRLSAMISGNPRLQIHYYHSVDDLRGYFQKKLRLALSSDTVH